jgi:hypothetical protein
MSAPASVRERAAGIAAQARRLEDEAIAQARACSDRGDRTPARLVLALQLLVDAAGFQIATLSPGAANYKLELLEGTMRVARQAIRNEQLTTAERERLAEDEKKRRARLAVALSLDAVSEDIIQAAEIFASGDEDRIAWFAELGDSRTHDGGRAVVEEAARLAPAIEQEALALRARAEEIRAGVRPLPNELDVRAVVDRFWRGSFRAYVARLRTVQCQRHTRPRSRGMRSARRRRSSASRRGPPDRPRLGEGRR